MFVTIEGIEGSGKSTLLAALAERFCGRGHTVARTREPGGTPLGDAVRDLFLDRTSRIAPLTEAFLVNAARAQHVLDVIGPRLAAGDVVLCDRFVDSTLAYQGYGRGLDLTMLRRLCTTATGGLVPDCTIVLDLPVERARERLRARGSASDRIETEREPFHERVRAGFLDLAADAPRYVVLDATLPVEELAERALRDVVTRTTRAAT